MPAEITFQKKENTFEWKKRRKINFMKYNCAYSEQYKVFEVIYTHMYNARYLK